MSLLEALEDPDSIRPAGGPARRRPRFREALAEAISRLPEREKLVVTLYYYEELTLREIGEVLGKPVAESQGLAAAHEGDPAAPVAWLQGSKRCP